MGQFLSMTNYLTVLNINQTTQMVAVRNQRGQTMSMSRELVETLYSARHYDRVCYLNKKGMAELLMSVRDVVFTVNFTKKVQKANIEKLLSTAAQNCFADSSAMRNLAKELTQGEDRTMTCHMVNVEDDLGRSKVVDLETDDAEKNRLVDHRTINYIIFKNVKYEYKEGGQNFSDIDTSIGKDCHKWDPTQLAIGDVFSGTNYYELVSDIDGTNSVFCIEKSFNDRGVTIDRSLLNTEMYNSSLFQEE